MKQNREMGRRQMGNVRVKEGCSSYFKSESICHFSGVENGDDKLIMLVNE